MCFTSDVVEFRGDEIEGFNSERNYLVPLFVAIACTASRLQTGTLPLASVVDAVRDLIHARMASEHWNEVPLVKLLLERFDTSGSSFQSGYADDLRTINMWFGESAPVQDSPLISFGSGCFELRLCPSDKIDAVQVLGRIYRVASTASRRAGGGSIQGMS